MQQLEAPRFMMATKAMHKLGDISRKAPSLCLIYGEEGEDWVGHFVAGHGFADVHFPKKTTREPNTSEKKKYNGVGFGVGGRVQDIIIFPGFEVPTGAIVVKTSNSIYRFGKAGKDGERTITRDGSPLEFATAKILFLKVGRPMFVSLPDGRGWETSSVSSITSIKAQRTRRSA